MIKLVKTDKDDIEPPVHEDIDKEGLTKKENSAHKKLMEFFDEFMKLPFQHPEDTRELTYAIHLIQGLLTMRIARRQYPKGWVTYHMEDDECVIEEK